MGCFQTETHVVVLLVLVSVAIAAWAALLPQYAFISWAAGALYYHVAVRRLEPLCEWRRYYYAVFAAGIIASVATYIYALDAAVKYAESGDRMIFGRELSPREYAFWMSIQQLCILFTALMMLPAYAFAMKSLYPSKEHPPNKYPQLPRSRGRLDSFIEALGVADDVCTQKAPHDELQRLICRGDVSVANDLPNYALIIATYYALFRRRDIGLAENLLRLLKSRDLSDIEKDAVKVLEAALKAATTCNVKAVCKVAATDWAGLLKELVLLHFTYDKRAVERLKCKTVKAFDRYEIYERGKGWYTEYVPDPRLYFIFHAVDRVEPLPACRQQK
jgi:hypothetical protein